MLLNLTKYREQRVAAVPQSVELHYFPLPKHHLFTAKEFPGISRANMNLPSALEDFLSALTIRTRQQYGIAVKYGTKDERETFLDFINWRKNNKIFQAAQIRQINFQLGIVR